MCFTLITFDANCSTERYFESCGAGEMETLRCTNSSPGLEVDDLVRRHAAVGSNRSKQFWALRPHQAAEENRIGASLRAAQARFRYFRGSSILDAINQVGEHDKSSASRTKTRR